MTFRDRNLADYLRADRVDRAEHDGPVVEVTDVRLSFGGLNVLNDVSFHVAHGERRRQDVHFQLPVRRLCA